MYIPYPELGPGERLAHMRRPTGLLFYFDLRNGAIGESYGPAERWDRWLYNGLHSLDFPLLYRTRPIWDLLVIAFMLGGIALSATVWSCIEASQEAIGETNCEMEGEAFLF